MLSTGEFGKIGLGCMGLSGNYGKGLSDIEFTQFIIGAIKQGIRIFDTADCYGLNGHNELLLGRAIKNFARDKVVIATKCGFERGQDNISLTINNNPEYIKKCC